jgi:hypothetical protein
MSEFTIKYFGSIEEDSDFRPRSELESVYAKGIGDLIWDANEEFIPHLSYRKGSTGHSSVKNQIDLKTDGLRDYTATMLTQKNILVFNTANDVVAFMSFRHDYDKRDYLTHPKLDIKWTDKVNYVTTIIVGQNYRGQKLSALLYDYVESRLPISVHANIVATRTWDGDKASNEKHISLLNKRGYKLTCTLHEEREFEGSSHNTVYYAKRVEREQKHDRRPS